MACQFMSERRGKYAIREMAGIFGVSSGAYYQRAKKEGDGELTSLIRLIQERHHYRYGSRVREALRRDYGKRVSRKKAVWLMRENGFSARGRRKFIPTTRSNHGIPACENILSREFQAGRGGEKTD
jgi:transposase InsO family protein